MAAQYYEFETNLQDIISQVKNLQSQINDLEKTSDPQLFKSLQAQIENGIKALSGFEGKVGNITEAFNQAFGNIDVSKVDGKMSELRAKFSEIKDVLVGIGGNGIDIDFSKIDTQLVRLYSDLKDVDGLLEKLGRGVNVNIGGNYQSQLNAIMNSLKNEGIMIDVQVDGKDVPQQLDNAIGETEREVNVGVNVETQALANAEAELEKIKAQFDVVKEAERELNEAIAESRNNPMDTDTSAFQAKIRDLTANVNAAQDELAAMTIQANTVMDNSQRTVESEINNVTKQMEHLQTLREKFSKNASLQTDAHAMDYYRNQLTAVDSEMAKLTARLTELKTAENQLGIKNQEMGSYMAELSNNEQTAALNAQKLSTAIQKVSVDTEKIIPPLKRTNTAINEQELELKKLSMQMQESAQKMQSFESSAGKLQSIFTRGLGFAMGGAALGGFIGQMVQVRSEFQAADIAIETMLGSKEKADDLMQKVRQYAKVSPLEFSDITRATQMMLGFNIEAEKVPRFMEALGDVSMGDRQKFNSLTLAFSQMSATGKLMGQDLNQMINAGFNPLQAMAAKTGKSIVELKKEMSDGKITSQMVQESFIAATSEGGKFYKMSANAAKTVQGQQSMLQDSVAAMLNEIGTASEGTIIKGIQGVTKLVEHWKEIGKVVLASSVAIGAYKTALMITNLQQVRANKAQEAAVQKSFEAAKAKVEEARAVQQAAMAKESEAHANMMESQTKNNLAAFNNIGNVNISQAAKDKVNESLKDITNNANGTIVMNLEQVGFDKGTNTLRELKDVLSENDEGFKNIKSAIDDTLEPYQSLVDAAKENVEAAMQEVEALTDSDDMLKKEAATKKLNAAETELQTRSEQYNTVASQINENTREKGVVVNALDSQGKVTNTAATTANTTSQVGNTGAVIANSAATQTATILEKAKTMAVNMSTKAWNAMKAAYASNPYGMILAAVGSLVTILMTLSSEESELAEAQEKLNESISDEVSKTQLQYNALKSSITSTEQKKEAAEALGKTMVETGMATQEYIDLMKEEGEFYDYLMSKEGELTDTVREKVAERLALKEREKAMEQFNESVGDVITDEGTASNFLQGDYTKASGEMFESMLQARATSLMNDYERRLEELGKTIVDPEELQRAQEHLRVSYTQQIEKLAEELSKDLVDKNGNKGNFFDAKDAHSSALDIVNETTEAYKKLDKYNKRIEATVKSQKELSKGAVTNNEIISSSIDKNKKDIDRLTSEINKEQSNLNKNLGESYNNNAKKHIEDYKAQIAKIEEEQKKLQKQLDDNKLKVETEFIVNHDKLLTDIDKQKSNLEQFKSYCLKHYGEIPASVKTAVDNMDNTFKDLDEIREAATKSGKTVDIKVLMAGMKTIMDNFNLIKQQEDVASKGVMIAVEADMSSFQQTYNRMVKMLKNLGIDVANLQNAANNAQKTVQNAKREVQNFKKSQGQGQGNGQGNPWLGGTFSFTGVSRQMTDEQLKKNKHEEEAQKFLSGVKKGSDGFKKSKTDINKYKDTQAFQRWDNKEDFETWEQKEAEKANKKSGSGSGNRHSGSKKTGSKKGSANNDAKKKFNNDEKRDSLKAKLNDMREEDEKKLQDAIDEYTIKKTKDTYQTKILENRKKYKQQVENAKDAAKKELEAYAQVKYEMDNVGKDNVKSWNNLDQAKKDEYIQKVNKEDSDKVNRIASLNIDSATKEYEENLKKIQQPIVMQQLEYLEKYGTLLEKRKAIEEKYNLEIKNAVDDGDLIKAQTKRQEKKAALETFDMEKVKKELDWDNIFNNLENMSKESLVRIQQQLRDTLAKEKLNPIDAKVIGEQIRKIDDILHSSDFWNSIISPEEQENQNFEQAKKRMNEATEKRESDEIKVSVANQNVNNIREEIKGNLSSQGINNIGKFLENGDIQEIINNQDITEEQRDALIAESDKLKGALDALRTAVNDLTDSTQEEEKAINEVNDTDPNKQIYPKTNVLDFSSSVMSKFDRTGGEASEKASQGMQKSVDKFKKVFEKDETTGKTKGLKELFKDKSNTIDTIQGVGGVMDAASGINGMLGGSEKATAALDGLNSSAGAVASFMQGDYLGAAMKAVDAIGSFQNALGLGGNEEDMQQIMEEMANKNEVLSRSIDNLAEVINNQDKSAKEQQQAYEQAIKASDEKIENQQRAIDAAASQWSNGWLGIGGHSSFYDTFNDDYGNKSGAFAKLNETLLKNGSSARINSISDLFGLSPEDAKLLETYNTTLIDDMLSMSHYSDDVKEQWQKYVDLAGEREALEMSFYESLTGISWDSFRDGFKNLLRNLDSSLSDFTKSIQDTANDMIIDDITDKYNEDLKKLYKQLADARKTENGKTSQVTQAEIDALKAEQQRIAQEALNERQWYIDNGLLQDTDKQDAAGRGYQDMSEDTGQEMNGRLTAIHITDEGIRSFLTTSLMYEGETISQIAADTRRILADTYIAVNGIYDNTKTLVEYAEESKDKLTEISNNLR